MAMSDGLFRVAAILQRKFDKLFDIIQDLIATTPVYRTAFEDWGQLFPFFKQLGAIVTGHFLCRRG